MSFETIYYCICIIIAIAATLTGINIGYRMAEREQETIIERNRRLREGGGL